MERRQIQQDVASLEAQRKESETACQELTQVLEDFFREGGTFADSPEAVKAAVEAVRTKAADRDYFTPIEFAYREGGEQIREAHESVYEELMEMYAGYVYPETYRHKQEPPLNTKERAERDRLRRLLDTLEKDPRFAAFAEKKERQTYEQYLRNLGFNEEQLRSKRRIVDIGAGARLFAGYCIRHDVNREVYSLDPYIDGGEEEGYIKSLWSTETKQQVDMRTVKAEREHLPFRGQSVDLILIHGAMPTELRHAGSQHLPLLREEVKRTFAEIERTLAPGGEARLWPILDSKEDHSYRTTRKLIDAELARLRIHSDYKVKVERVSVPPREERITYRIVLSRRNL